ncbi:hypothetical protein [Herbaspirillum rubrisubalbicans]|uniref:hypothetical protein n=1 Tax=Herbaspirillum rubrisubalbicans TaxID=80842 RepID=UPI0015C56B04|nr:hypothetical protein [Herbaspirillum rubrisubalbicans]NQE47042.1 hypothetical protein [Herbaspirillum rubrisubalbicans]
MNASYPCLTAEGLFFQLSCGGESLLFLLSPEALTLLSQRCTYAMDAFNLYRAHEALIHLTARIVALENKSLPHILLDHCHFEADAAIHRAASQRLPTLPS